MGYYDTPTDDIFNEIKAKSIEIWQTYDDTYGYASEKITKVESIGNVKDNWGFIVGMFDSDNQQKLVGLLSDKPRALVLEYL